MIARWLMYTIVDYILLPVWYFGAPFVALFTKPEEPKSEYTWGGLFGTYDNPPQGSNKWIRTGWFPGRTTNIKGYLNRVGWMWRNPGYGYQAYAGAYYDGDEQIILVSGDPHISDNKAKAGRMVASLKSNHDDRNLAFEFYLIHQWKWFPNKCLRIRVGYKLTSSKIGRLGFAPLVNTIQPWKQFGPRT